MLYKLDAANNISIPEEVLVSRLFKKDQLAFSYLYDNYAAALNGVIYRIVQDEESAEDVLQDAFVKIWNNFSQYDKTKGKLFTWIVNIARNLAIDHTRSKSFKNQQKNLDVDKIVGYIDSKKSTLFNPDQIGLKTMLDKLKPEQREILDLVYFGGYTQAEVANELNIPLGTVKTRIRMALITLRSIV
ncbi:MAG TPA: sigma-70 family RNA polymerase sigma factor [Chitinophagales bacterium]|nr:sigma-70 family RNA polymerase sigma factor [Chitinophagales bacterium]